MERRPFDSNAEDDAFDRIDALLSNASNVNAELRSPATAPRATSSNERPPIDRLLGAAEGLMLVRVALERDATVTPELRDSLEHALREVTDLCDDWGFTTTRVRVDFMREDLGRGSGDLKNDITELVRHLRYDARLWKPA